MLRLVCAFAMPVFPVAALVLLAGCRGAVGEKHHFATIDRETEEVINVFRVSVKGSSNFSNARYIAGYYDERAVDLFFNEVKAENFDPASTKGPDKIFNFDCTGKDAATCKAEREARLVAIPSVGDADIPNGAFVMILSTNADSIAGTIGSLAENEVLLKSVLFLATKEDREKVAELNARSATTNKQRLAVKAELTALFNAAKTAGTETEREQAYVAILQALAAGLSPGESPQFSNFEEAKIWFAAKRQEPGS